MLRCQARWPGLYVEGRAFLFCRGAGPRKGETLSSEKETLSQQPTEVLKEMLRIYRDIMKTATRAMPFEAHSVELIELVLSERPDECRGKRGNRER
jgi:hypothetical protein